MATIAKIFKNKSGFMLALLLIFFIGTAAVMAHTLTDEKKEKATTEKKNTVVKKQRKLANQYWVYNGGVATSEGSYTIATGDPCEGSTNLCQIYAPENPANLGHPRIVPGSAFETRISNKNTGLGDVFLED